MTKIDCFKQPNFRKKKKKKREENKRKAEKETKDNESKKNSEVRKKKGSPVRLFYWGVHAPEAFLFLFQ